MQHTQNTNTHIAAVLDTDVHAYMHAGIWGHSAGSDSFIPKIKRVSLATQTHRVTTFTGI